MTDEEFIARFEDGTLESAGFHHEHHIKLVWLYLRRHSLLETLERFSEGLKRFAAANGKANLYHTTITWSFVFLINERCQLSETDQRWECFMEMNSDLFDWKNNILNSYYDQETLRSELA